MKETLKLNRVSRTMAEALLVKWCEKPGDSFAKNDVLHEIETEKVTQEVTAPKAETLIEILVEEDSELSVENDVCITATNETWLNQTFGSDVNSKAGEVN